MSKVIVDPELDPALEEEFYMEPPELRARLDIEEMQGVLGEAEES